MADVEESSGADLDPRPGVVKTGSVLALWLGTRCTLTLKEDSLQLDSAPGDPDSAPAFFVALEDVIGLKVMKESPYSSIPFVCRAELCSYQKVKRLLSSSFYRKFATEVIEFSNEKDFETNYKTAMEWREAIQLQCRKNSKKLFIFPPEHQIDSLEPQRLLVIVNPFSGRKNGLKLYQTIARPLFELAGVVIVQELITEKQGHAREYVETFDLTQITGIVLASGDGLIYEVINGLMARSDWKEAIKTPIGLIPTGSGNALTSSLLHEADEEKAVIENAVLQIINGGIQMHDIASVSTNSSHSYMAVLIHWALTGAVDIESERLRILGGELRTLVAGLVCIVMKRSYHGQLSYLPIEDDDDDKGESSSSVEATAPSDKGDTSEEAVRPSTCINVTDPIPEKWKTIEGNFVMFIGLMVSHMSDSIMGHADIKIGSGEHRIVYAFEDVTRAQLLTGLAGSPSTVKYDTFHEIRTRAFRLSPVTPGIISVDGEQVEYGPLQVQVHPGMMRLFSRVKRSNGSLD